MLRKDEANDEDEAEDLGGAATVALGGSLALPDNQNRDSSEEAASERVGMRERRSKCDML